MSRRVRAALRLFCPCAAPRGSLPAFGQIIHTLGNLGFVPVNLDARNTYVGLYATDTFDLTSQLSLTLGGRLDVAKIRMADLTGASPDPNNDLTYARPNPLAGLTYKVTPGLTLYGGYSEWNRAPTPLEIGCSNPNRPCLIESALDSDPPLRQVRWRAPTATSTSRRERRFRRSRRASSSRVRKSP